jgi:hypothetical protein
LVPSLAPWRNLDGSEPWKSLSNGLSFPFGAGRPPREISTPVENPVEIRLAAKLLIFRPVFVIFRAKVSRE